MPLVRRKRPLEAAESQLDTHKCKRFKSGRKELCGFDKIGYVQDHFHSLHRSFPFDHDHLRDLLAKEIGSFLNAKGGILCFGCRENGTVYGEPLPRKHEDLLKLVIDDVFKKFRPMVEPQRYRVTCNRLFDPYLDPDMVRMVVEIRVQAGNDYEMYEDVNHETYLRKGDAPYGPLTPHEIKRFTTQQLRKKLEALRPIHKTLTPSTGELTPPTATTKTLNLAANPAEKTRFRIRINRKSDTSSGSEEDPIAIAVVKPLVSERVETDEKNKLEIEEKRVKPAVPSWTSDTKTERSSSNKGAYNTRLSSGTSAPAKPNPKPAASLSHPLAMTVKAARPVSPVKNSSQKASLRSVTTRSVTALKSAAIKPAAKAGSGSTRATVTNNVASTKTNPTSAVKKDATAVELVPSIEWTTCKELSPTKPQPEKTCGSVAFGTTLSCARTTAVKSVVATARQDAKTTGVATKPVQLAPKPTLVPAKPGAKTMVGDAKPVQTSAKTTVSTTKPAQSASKATAVKSTVATTKLVQPPVKTTAGTTKLVQPPVKTTVASTKLVQPPVKTTAGTTKLVQPPVKTTVASTKLVQPPVKTTAGTTKLVQPPVKMTVASTKLVQPPVNTTVATTKPVKPPVKTTVATTKPVKPPVKTTVATTKPVKPPVKTTVATTKPAKTTVATTKPVKKTAPTTRPVKTPVKTTLATTKSVKTTVTTTKPPVKTTAVATKPVKTTVATTKLVKTTAPTTKLPVKTVKTTVATTKPVKTPVKTAVATTKLPVNMVKTTASTTKLPVKTTAAATKPVKTTVANTKPVKTPVKTTEATAKPVWPPIKFTVATSGQVKPPATAKVSNSQHSLPATHSTTPKPFSSVNKTSFPHKISSSRYGKPTGYHQQPENRYFPPPPPSQLQYPQMYYSHYNVYPYPYRSNTMGAACSSYQSAAQASWNFSAYNNIPRH